MSRRYVTSPDIPSKVLLGCKRLNNHPGQVCYLSSPALHSFAFQRRGVMPSARHRSRSVINAAQVPVREIFAICNIWVPRRTSDDCKSCKRLPYILPPEWTYRDYQNSARCLCSPPSIHGIGPHVIVSIQALSMI